jgi:hypothetical protein
MLFARFLDESDLLMHPDGYPVSLNGRKEDVESFDSPLRSEWEVTGHYASRMLPNVFRPDSPALALQLPLESEATDGGLHGRCERSWTISERILNVTVGGLETSLRRRWKRWSEASRRHRISVSGFPMSGRSFRYSRRDAGSCWQRCAKAA